jgi:8-hydroxy-5-deazaflavin:NADPH oxidoreductase
VYTVAYSWISGAWFLGAAGAVGSRVCSLGALDIRETRMDTDFDRVSVIGGSGALGRGLAYRFLGHGVEVVIGSRSAERAEQVAAELAARPGVRGPVRGDTNAGAVAGSEIVVIAIPYDGHAELVGPLDVGNRIVVSCVNPLGFDRQGPFGLNIEDRSAAEEAARLHPEARVVGAFHHVAAGRLLEPEPLRDEQVLVCGDDAEAKGIVCELATAVTGARGVDAGPLRNARYLEPFTAVLISVNKTYKTHSGVALTGL